MTAPANKKSAPKDEALDNWIKIEPDGSITAFSGKVELGTGVRTALGQIVAEELDVPMARVQMVMGDTSLTPDEGYTAGSRTIQNSGAALRNAAAEARQALLELASESLDAMVTELTIDDGVISVTHHPDRTTDYAALMGGKLFNRTVTGTAPLKKPEDYRIVGTPMARTDLPAKVLGQASYVQDVRLPGMLHARLVRPPGLGANLISLDEHSVRDVPGLVKVVRLGNFVGVVAEREEQALQAAKQLKVEWEDAKPLPGMANLYNTLRTQPTTDELVIEAGDVEAALPQTTIQLRATYCQPYHAHASIGPSCAVADMTAEGGTVWSSTQGPYPLRGSIAQLLELPPERVHVIHVEGAGCYGQNGSDDAAADAALLSRAVGKPVRVQWTREEEFVWEPKAAAMTMELSAGLNAGGTITAWTNDIWTTTHAARPRLAGQLLAAQLMTGQPAPARGFGGGDRNAATDYELPNQRVTMHWLSQSPLRVSSFRGLGAPGNTFANECFVDELAAAANIDPLEFRLRHLTDPRGRDVLNAAAEKAGWATCPTAPVNVEGWVEGWGLAFVHYENKEAYAAAVAQVQVNLASGAVRVPRIVIAHDCGLIINPDGLKNQIEGNVLQSLSRALKEEVIFNEQQVTSTDWETYPILTFSEVPDVEIVLINRPDIPATGAGEPATVTTAPAVANAIFNATGARLRQVPFTPSRVKAAMGESTR